MRVSSSGLAPQTPEGEKRCLNSELWHACAGPLVSLPAVGSRVVYFPQGHSEQVAASTNKEVDAQIPNYPSLPPQLICQLHDVTMHADVETDEVYAQMTLQPLSPQEQKETFFPAELGAPSKQPTNYFCKTLTASDTSTHGGFSVPRRAAEKVFPPLDFSQTPPAQELIARDLHDNEWKFRHIFRGQPKRHLLTTGWSVFVSAKRLVAGDSVLFIWNENNQLLLGIRRANRPQTVMPSSVLSSDSMHIGLLAAAAHAAATNSRFTIFYNPRASPSEFVIPLAKYIKAVYHTRVSIGMRFRMLFETEESSVRRYMGTITGISDLDPVRWPNSHWRSVKVGWDESTAGERQPRVSLWEIEPLTTFPMYPSPFPLRLKRPWPPGLPSLNGFRDDGMGLNSPLMWLRDSRDWGIQSLNFQGAGAAPWVQPRLEASLLGMQPDVYQAMAAAALQEMRGVDPSKLASSAMLQFQQPQNILGGSVSLLPSDILQQVQQAQSQRTLYPSSQECQNLSQTQSHIHLQPQQCKPFAEQQQKLLQQQLHMSQSQQQQLQMPPQNQQQPLPVPQNQEQQQGSLHNQLQPLNNQQQQSLTQQQLSQQQYQQQLSQPQHLQLAQQHVQQKQHKQTLPQSPHKLLQPTTSAAEQQQQNQHLSHQLQQHVTSRQIPSVVSSISQLVSTSQSPSPTAQSISQFPQQQNYSDSSGNSVIPSSLSPLRGILGSLTPEEASHVLNLQRSTQLVSSNVWLPKRVGGESILPPGNQCVMPQVEQYGQPHANVSIPSVPLSPFPGRECSVDQEVSTDVQNNLLFGVNIDNPSLLVQNDITDLRNVVSNADSTAMPYTAANFLGASETEFQLNPAMATSSSLDETGYLQSENVGRVNPQNGTFVKVYKSGSFGRSLDITRFSSYDELRSELGHMFGLEGQLEDPLRSGWQLVIVDRENDVLLLGDDPWQEFVNNVSCIKILSSEEVQQMGKPEDDNNTLLSAVPISSRLSGSTCDNYISRQDPRNLSNGITSVGSLEY